MNRIITTVDDIHAVASDWVERYDGDNDRNITLMTQAIREDMERQHLKYSSGSIRTTADELDGDWIFTRFCQLDEADRA